jgi:hypothetical protein
MRNKRFILCALLLSGLGMTGLQAQESINTTGTNASGSGGTVSYSVGQITYDTHVGTNGSVTQGVQQPYEISTVSAIEEAIGVNLTVTAYPNPANDYLTLEVKDLELSALVFQLYDINGKLLQNKKITANLTNIAISNLLPATYFVKVIQENKEVKSFKIIKN